MPRLHWSSHELFWHAVPAILLSLLTGGLEAAALTPLHATPAGMTTTLFDEALLEVRLNGVKQPQPAMFLMGGSGVLYASADDLRRWRLPMPGQEALRYRGVDYYAAAAIPGVRTRVDMQTLQAYIDLPGSAFPETRLDAGRERGIQPRPAMPGGFMNYDLSLQHVRGETQADAQIRLGYFNSLGVGSMGLLGRDLGREGDIIRLETSWLVDDPTSLTGLRLGDAISRAGAWGRPVRFGGIQWGTRFATQPGFITFPSPVLEGVAELPSTLDVYVNNLRTYHGDTAPGPFSLNNLPVITGSGEVQMVVRDLLGREQIVVQPYYASNRLLKADLTDQTYEFGFLRDKFGVESNDYGSWLGVATHRRGYSDRLTGEWRAELQEESQALGVAALYVPQHLGVLDASLAFSHGDRGGGGLLALGFERQDRLFSFGLHTQYASRGFAQLGLPDHALPAVRRTTLRANVASGRWGSLGAAYVRQDNRGSADTELLNATYSYNIARGWYLSLNAFRNLTDERNYAINVTLTRAVDERTTASLATTAQEGADSSQFQLQRSLPVGPGVGYRLLAEHGEFDHVLGGVSMQNDVGTYTLEADRFGDETAYRGLVSGSVAVMDGHAFLSRRLGDGFAVVEVPGYSNVRVYAENQLVAETDEDGLALLPGLRAYDRNRISIESQDLPLNARFDKLQMEASPYFGSGTYVRFPVTHASAATFRVLLPDGTPLPVGATARVEGGSEDFPVGRDGNVYAAGLAGAKRVVFRWPGHKCEVELVYQETDEPLPDLGEFICVGDNP